MIPPRIAILLTAAGALPFLAGVAMTMDLWPWPGDGVALIRAYGVVILCFMAGVHWGFAARGAPAWAYVLSVIPALHAFFFALSHPWAIEGQALSHLIAGFIAILVIDMVFQARHLAPRWWLTLRIPVTAVVLACLWVARGG